MLTLRNYDSSRGDAAAILVANLEGATVLDSSSIDQTQRLIEAGILRGGSNVSAIVETFGSEWSDVARYALDVKTYPDVEI